MADWKDRLSTIYFEPKHPAFAGAKKLHIILQNDGFNVGVHRIRQRLQEQDAYSLQKPVRRKFNIHFLLIAIDVFSRYLWVIPVKHKTHISIIDGFKKIFDQARKANIIRTDKGSEFRNRWAKALFTKSDVKHSPQ